MSAMFVRHLLRAGASGRTTSRRLPLVAIGSQRPVSTLPKQLVQDAESAGIFSEASLRIGQAEPLQESTTKTAALAHLALATQPATPSLEDYELHGSGAVRLGRHRRSGRTVAVRVVPRDSADFAAPLASSQREVVQSFESFEDEAHRYFVLRSSHEPVVVSGLERLLESYDVPDAQGLARVGSGAMRRGRHRRTGRSVAVQALAKDVVKDAPVAEHADVKRSREVFQDEGLCYVVSRCSFEPRRLQDVYELLGASGAVRLGRDRQTGRSVAIRSVPKRNAELELPAAPEGSGQCFQTFEDAEQYHIVLRSSFELAC